MFIVEALRYGDRESHSYVIGVYSDFNDAAFNAALVDVSRSGKYKCVINKFTINSSYRKNSEQIIRDFGVDFFNEIVDQIKNDFKNGYQ